ncbi:hypothetical protein N7539_000990 [Penicillium diatomitis]|uniref:Cytomegalovirus gH-receptor family protein n=1 Tax=Penicillium diatomitis TaxID=2819901 RepID=A0A9W9XP93_9EURO|nr:uncharacterized protein N7539_000990 [Penicillium diatomitis]KAJ5495874.1 hypothetical protein N7539_000990 [Penicillium diatomitis]
MTSRVETCGSAADQKSTGQTPGAPLDDMANGPRINEQGAPYIPRSTMLMDRQSDQKSPAEKQPRINGTGDNADGAVRDESVDDTTSSKLHSHRSEGLGILVELSSDDTADNGRATLLEGSKLKAALAGLAEETPLEAADDNDPVLTLSSDKIQELISSPDSIPIRTEDAQVNAPKTNTERRHENKTLRPEIRESILQSLQEASLLDRNFKTRNSKSSTLETPALPVNSAFHKTVANGNIRNRPHNSRTVSTPGLSRPPHLQLHSERITHTWASRSRQERSTLDRDVGGHLAASPQIAESPATPMAPVSIPIPPVSLPTYLQLELASGRPSPLYIHRPSSTDFPYESSSAKIERLMNFLILPGALEQVLCFGSFACLDSWLYSFTILPLRFIKAVYILFESWMKNLNAEFWSISGFVINGVGRVWKRRTQNGERQESETDALPPTASESSAEQDVTGSADHDSRHRDSDLSKRRHRTSQFRRHHRRSKSIPSTLLPDDKADILTGLLMIATCWALMYFDASRMYHWIRGQAAIKLYVIYNVLEVLDRLLAAIGQDVLECLFSREALERRPDGRSKIMRPFGLFLAALVYTVAHATSLFSQVMTLNVAVNSYSNALMTLLLSNQFVEIKSTVFRKFEKENLFQLTCADVVERFQLWLMLTIIASRNIVETGAFNFIGDLGLGSSLSGQTSTSTNSTPLSTPPRSASSILPQAFTFFPSSILASVSSVNSFLPTFGQVLGPFLVVLGSEMLVDWLKHAYINKFNNYRPALYGRYLDVLAKDYYTNAFGDQNLTRRLGLPVIPLSCLFIRVSVQTYQMFLASMLPQHPSSTALTATSLAAIHRNHAPGPLPSTAPLTLRNVIPVSVAHVTSFFSTLVDNAMPSPAQSVQIFTIVLLLTSYIVLLILKLLLGMGLLAFARSRYKRMKLAEHESRKAPSSETPAHDQPARKDSFNVEGSRRAGGWGMVELGDEKRRWIYGDDPDGLRRVKEKEDRDKNKDKDLKIDHVHRYEMVAKKIW